MGTLQERRKTEAEFATSGTKIPAAEPSLTKQMWFLFHLWFLVNLLHKWISQVKLPVDLTWRVQVISWQLKLHFTVNLAYDQKLIIKKWSIISRSILSKCSFKEELEEASGATVRSLLCPQVLSDSQRPNNCPAQCHSFSLDPQSQRKSSCKAALHMYMWHILAWPQFPFGAPTKKDKGPWYGAQGEGSGP